MVIVALECAVFLFTPKSKFYNPSSNFSTKQKPLNSLWTLLCFHHQSAPPPPGKINPDFQKCPLGFSAWSWITCGWFLRDFISSLQLPCHTFGVSSKQPENEECSSWLSESFSLFCIKDIWTIQKDVVFEEGIWAECCCSNATYSSETS